jgi:surface protein
MNKMFQGCSKLANLPDISKWNVGAVTNMSFMFYGCTSISNLPDISVWNTKEVVDMTSMFYLCSGLDKLPELDKWNVTNLKKYSSMFDMCKLTLNIPAFSRRYSNFEIIEYFYSHNYLQCFKCKEIPKLCLKDNEEALISCVSCGWIEDIKISKLVNSFSSYSKCINCLKNIKCSECSRYSKWIGRDFIRCSIHKNEPLPFIYLYCEICNKFICENCKSEHVNKSNKEIKHKIEQIYDLDIIICEEHFLKCSEFCLECNKYICEKCIENAHQSHQKKEEKDDKLNLEILNDYYKKLNEGLKKKSEIINQESNFQGDDFTIYQKFLDLIKKDLEEIENFKKLGKILYYSSKKIKSEKNREEIIQNYLNIFNYICNLYNEENIEKFKKLTNAKLNESKIIVKNLSDDEKNFLQNYYKENIFSRNSSSASDFEKKKKFIENTIDFSRILKKHIIMEKNKNPNNYIDIDEILSDIHQVSDGINSNKQEFILSLIGKIAQNNGTEVYINRKPNEKFNNIDIASIQSFFSLGNQTKYVLHFNFGVENENILNSPEKKKDFIQTYKPIIAKELEINEKNLIFRDVHRGSIGVSLSAIDKDVSIEKLKNIPNLENIEKKPLLEIFQISANILDPKGDRSNKWGKNEKRGNEDYIPPLDNWRGYGINVIGKYDNGNNDWLDYKNKNGEFAIAYMGINNFQGDKSKMVSDLNNYAKDIRRVIPNKLYRRDSNRRNSGIFKYLFDYTECGDGICLFQNPKYAENSAGIIDVPGYQIKLMLMCRVNPKKIRQPEHFNDCWILNPTPDEIRPYRILIKIIPNSPLTDGSFLTVSYSPIDYILEIFKSNDKSFYDQMNVELSDYSNILEVLKLNDENMKKDEFIIKVYTDNNYFRDINNYLRNKTAEIKMPIKKHIQSFIYCLQELLKDKKNVEEGTIVYRGIEKYKLPKDIGTGSKFYFREFISTSIDKEVSLKFINKEAEKRIGTLLIIKLKNNKKRNYCLDITKFSRFPKEKEILISSHCYFNVTEIKRNPEGVDEVNLDCEGFLLDEQIKEQK